MGLCFSTLQSLIRLVSFSCLCCRPWPVFIGVKNIQQWLKSGLVFAYGSVESRGLISTLILMFRDQIIVAMLLLLLKVVVVVVVGELSGLVCRGVGPEGSNCWAGQGWWSGTVM